jgi:type I restriction enzyme, R subunit
MRKVGQIEPANRNRFVQLFEEQLQYTYIGNREKQEGNSNILKSLEVDENIKFHNFCERIK